MFQIGLMTSLILFFLVRRHIDSFRKLVPASKADWAKTLSEYVLVCGMGEEILEDDDLQERKWVKNIIHFTYSYIIIKGTGSGCVEWPISNWLGTTNPKSKHWSLDKKRR